MLVWEELASCPLTSAAGGPIQTGWAQMSSSPGSASGAELLLQICCISQNKDISADLDSPFKELSGRFYRFKASLIDVPLAADIFQREEIQALPDQVHIQRWTQRSLRDLTHGERKAKVRRKRC